MTKKRLITFILMITGTIFFGQHIAAAQGSGEDASLIKNVKEILKEKTVQSGTLDIYDGKINKVRNLRLMAFQNGILDEGKVKILTADFRDIQTGEVVTVQMEGISTEGKLDLGEFRIKEVKAVEDAAGAEDKEYTDEEIQKVMTDYVDRQGQFNDGKVMLFDSDNEVMRNLQLKELKKEVRRIGIFYSSSSQFVDANTGDLLDIDISVQKKEGKLTVQALRIRNVRRAPK